MRDLVRQESDSSAYIFPRIHLGSVASDLPRASTCEPLTGGMTGGTAMRKTKSFLGASNEMQINLAKTPCGRLGSIADTLPKIAEGGGGQEGGETAVPTPPLPPPPPLPSHSPHPLSSLLPDPPEITVTEY